MNLERKKSQMGEKRRKVKKRKGREHKRRTKMRTKNETN